MIQRIYIDTSVIGGMYDTEFDVFTKIFFDKAFRAEIVLIVSSLLEEELINAPGDVKSLATLNNADVLVSWNFRHIVNLKRIRGYNSINLREGLHTLEIRSPKELMEYEN